MSGALCFSTYKYRSRGLLKIPRYLSLDDTTNSIFCRPKSSGISVETAPFRSQCNQRLFPFTQPPVPMCPWFRGKPSHSPDSSSSPGTAASPDGPEVAQSRRGLRSAIESFVVENFAPILGTPRPKYAQPLREIFDIPPARPPQLPERLRPLYRPQPIPQYLCPRTSAPTRKRKSTYRNGGSRSSGSSGLHASPPSKRKRLIFSLLLVAGHVVLVLLHSFGKVPITSLSCFKL